jgi:acetyltransferase-like isoleucine patch superfamily enzyme
MASTFYILPARINKFMHCRQPSSGSVLSFLYGLWLRTTYPFARIGRGLSIHFTTSLPRPTAPLIRIGNGVVIEKDGQVHVRVNLGDHADPVVLIDDRCVLGRRSTISAKKHIHLESNVIVGPLVLIQDHTHAYANVSLPIRDQGTSEGGIIRIGRNCSIGRGAVIHCGTGELTIGPDCIIEPNALVIRSFPECSIIAGNPARVVGQVSRKGTAPDLCSSVVNGVSAAYDRLSTQNLRPVLARR